MQRLLSDEWFMRHRGIDEGSTTPVARKFSTIRFSNPEQRLPFYSKKRAIERNVVNRTGTSFTIVMDPQVMKYIQHLKEKWIQPSQSALHPDPVRPPWAPVLVIRVIASCWVVHVMEVPGEFTRGKAAQIKLELHGVVTNFPLTH